MARPRATTNLSRRVDGCGKLANFSDRAGPAAKIKELHEGMMSKLNEGLTPEQQSELKKKMTPPKEKPPEQP